MSRFRTHAFDWIAWFFFASVPVVIFWRSATSLAEQGAASGGPLDNAAFYPRVIAGLMGVAVAVHGIRLLLGRVQGQSAVEAEAGTRLGLALAALFVGYLVVLPYSGFHLATPVLLIVMTRALGLGLFRAVLGSLALWLAASFVFEGLLNVVLPVGLFNITVFN
ncbi:tripartite tricarboxylate transporter TctB family protein [Psychromarinibacter sp. C21-152]|uniref:Tripartite tricarboxylate transporter TctB family protein n=1 Tax=Psychromarinibacter sediminicola TaxID=3033385 RepID=A0AAE3T7U0_9RHOB|nr:tripartite tricarboxylate transporter TctB family protein [Psychromarinibacter sediminicola]MDF0599379.1 tripartite tricarboxylate transporter TctB family protein [Psychromarinibacter sediminicola]